MWRYICTSYLVMMGLCLQAASVSGLVKDQRTNKGIPFALIYVHDVHESYMTDEEGHFKIDLEPGTYHMEFSSLGYYPYSLFEIEVSNSGTTEFEVTLEVKVNIIDSVVVQANEFYRTPESPLGVLGFSQLELMTTPGSTMDLSKFIKTLPGVSPKVAFGYNLSVRGGAPFENTYYIDGIEVPVITHFNVQGASGGPNGLINPRLLQSARLFTANIPSQYSDATSSVLDMKAKMGSTDQWNWNFTLGATDFGITGSGPTSQNSSLLFSARESFSQHMLKALGVPVIPFYSDAQVNWNWKINSEHEVTAIGLMGYDKYNLNLDAETTDALAYNTGYIPEGKQFLTVLGINYKIYSGDVLKEWIMSHNTFYNRAYKFAYNDPEANQLLDFTTRNQNTNLTFHQTNYLPKGATLKMGLELKNQRFPYEIHRYQFDQKEEALRLIHLDGKLNILRYGGFLSLSSLLWNDQLDYNISVRTDGNNYNNRTRNPVHHVSPRGSLTYHLNPAWSLSTSFGKYHQLPPSILLAANEAQNEAIDYIQSRQGGLGIRYTSDIGYRMEANLYGKYYSQYPFLLQSDISLANATSDYVSVGDEPAVSSGKGKTYGITFLVKKQLTKKLGWQINYAFGRSLFKNKNSKYSPSSWDQRNALNLIATYSPGNTWKFSSRWFYSTGSPYSPYDREATADKFNWEHSFRGIFDYSEVNTKRLSPFHSLDFRVDKQFNFLKWTLSTYIDVQNIYGSELGTIPYLTAVRSEDGFLMDPENVNRYLIEDLNTDTGRILPTVGVIIDF